MGTSTIRPNGTVSAFNGGVTGAATAQAALSDNSDASYVAVPLDVYDLTTFTLPTGAQIRSVTNRVRHLHNGGADPNMVLQHRVGSSGSMSTSDQFGSTGGAITTVTGAPRPTNPSGAAWSQADIDALQLYVSSLGSASRAYEAYVDVAYNEIPVAAVTAPAAGATVTTSQPAVTASYSDPDGDAMERYRVKVFSAAQYGAGGFDPETSTPTWDSGDVYASSVSTTVGTPLANGATYRAYVKVGDSTPSGYSAKWSAWDYHQFNVVFSTPGVPALSAPTVDAATASIVTTITSGSLPVGATSETVEVQRSTDGGVTWATVRGALAVAFTASGQTFVAHDYEVPRGATVAYRARTNAVAGGNVVSSAWSSTTASVLMPKTGGWRLKSSSTPALNILSLCADTTAFSSTSDEDQATFQAQGRPDPIVHGGVIRDEVFEALPLAFKSDAEYAAFEALRALREPLLLQTTYGDTGPWEQRWVRLGKRTVTRQTYQRMNTAAFRWVTVELVEVAVPAVTA